MVVGKPRVRWQAPKLLDSEDGCESYYHSDKSFKFACVCYEVRLYPLVCDNFISYLIFFGHPPFYGLPQNHHVMQTVLVLQEKRPPRPPKDVWNRHGLLVDDDI